MTALALDTSVAVPLLVETHEGVTSPSCSQRFVERLLHGADLAGRLPVVLSRLGIAGGAVYDALVALAAMEHDAELATRDRRARATYETVGVRVVVAE